MPTPTEWVVVVPVKEAALGKSRLAADLEPGLRAALVSAMAIDTVAAAAGAPGVRRVLVVTPDAALGAALAQLDRVDVLPEPPADGTPPLLAAIRSGVARASDVDPSTGVAVLLGDVPALRSDDLGAALAQAAAHDRAVVPDADGTGTTLLTAGPGVALEPRFGPGSAAAHRELGHVQLDIPVTSSLRRDVDVRADLDRAVALGVGPRTGEALASARPRSVGPWSAVVGWAGLVLGVLSTVSGLLGAWSLIDSVRRPESFGELAAYAIYLPAAVLTGVPAFVVARVQASRGTGPRWRTRTTTVLAIPGLVALAALAVLLVRGWLDR